MICTEIGWLDRNIADERLKSYELQKYQKQLFARWFAQKSEDRPEITLIYIKNLD